MTAYTGMRHQITRKSGRGPSHVDPEGAQGEPTLSGAASVSPAVRYPSLTDVSQPAVQLDEDPLLVVGDVVQPQSARDTRSLTSAARKTVRALHVLEEPHLHGALRTVCDIGQHIGEKPPPAVPRLGLQERPQRRLGCLPSKKCTSEESQDLVGTSPLGEIENRLLEPGAPRPVEFVNALVGVPAPMDSYSEAGPDVDRGVDHELNRRRGSSHQSVRKPRGPEGPGRSRAHAEQRGRRLPPPPLSAGNREIHPMAHAGPPSGVEPMAHRPVRDASREALLPGDESALLVDDKSQRGQVRRCRRATEYGTERAEIRHRPTIVKPWLRGRCLSTGVRPERATPLIVGTR
jgi:hypothetical protein